KRDVAQRVSEGTSQSRKTARDDHATQIWCCKAGSDHRPIEEGNGGSHSASRRTGFKDPKGQRPDRAEETFAANGAHQSVSSGLTHISNCQTKLNNNHNKTYDNSILKKINRPLTSATRFLSHHARTHLLWPFTDSRSAAT